MLLELNMIYMYTYHSRWIGEWEGELLYTVQQSQRT